MVAAIAPVLAAVFLLNDGIALRCDAGRPRWLGCYSTDGFDGLETRHTHHGLCFILKTINLLVFHIVAMRNDWEHPVNWSPSRQLAAVGEQLAFIVHSYAYFRMPCKHGIRFRI
jgi:hypothetical protein